MTAVATRETNNDTRRVGAAVRAVVLKPLERYRSGRLIYMNGEIVGPRVDDGEGAVTMEDFRELATNLLLAYGTVTGG